MVAIIAPIIALIIVVAVLLWPYLFDKPLRIENVEPKTEKTRNPAIVIGCLILAAAIIAPWVSAYRADSAMTYQYGLIQGRQIACCLVDGSFFDRYYCLVYDGTNNARVSWGHGTILLDGNQVQFPRGKNFGILQPNGQIRFSQVVPADLSSDSSGKSEIYYVLGRIPKFKQFRLSAPSLTFMTQQLDDLQ